MWCRIVTAMLLSLPAAAQTVPLCPGLSVVTAVHQSDGDYESIKTIETVTDTAVRLKYSSERMVQDWLLDTQPKLQKLLLSRSVRVEDLRSAKLYLQQFSTELPELIPETTAIGTSAAVLGALKREGHAEIGIFIAYSQQKPSLDRNVHPNVYDNQMVGRIERVGAAPVLLPVIVNDVPRELPAIRARGDILGDKSEFFFLDDERNPLTLKFSIGIGAGQNGADRDALRVTKISYRCDEAPPGATLEKVLAAGGKADLYSIHFSFGSDVIRDESEPTLREIADLLGRHSDWKLGVNGHTDDIAGDAYNLALSQKRAAAVKRALTTRYGIDPGRLATAGFGERQPKDTNDTLEGRARNRRVELVRQP
jgi:outer membrane protein OmpA-like peptidoglycan-associated protein